MAKPNEYFRGETVEVTGTITDKDNAAADPVPGSGDAVVVTIIDPQSVIKVDDVAATNEGTGAYYKAYAIPDAAASDGEWMYDVTSRDGAGNDKSIGSGSFKVKARVGR